MGFIQTMGADKMIKLPPLKKVIIESPFRPTQERSIEQHRAYLRFCLQDSLARGESPFASHLFLTEVLDDDIPRERALGIEAAWPWAYDADCIAAYVDFGVSAGMKTSLDHYEKQGIPIERRKLDDRLVRAVLDLG